MGCRAGFKYDSDWRWGKNQSESLNAVAGINVWPSQLIRPVLLGPRSFPHKAGPAHPDSVFEREIHAPAGIDLRATLAARVFVLVSHRSESSEQGL
jgi:hypothetical protein